MEKFTFYNDELRILQHTFMKKYELTKKSITFEGRTLFQIKSLRSIPEIALRKGALGGYIESEKNLSQEGPCWVFKNAYVMDDAVVKEDARVYAYCIIKDQAVICGNAFVYEGVWVYDQAVVEWNSVVYENARIFGKAVISGGEDGPRIVASSYINFNVSYGHDYLFMVLPYDYLCFSFSQVGPICGSDGFCGNLDEFKIHLETNYDYLREKDTLVVSATHYLNLPQR